MPVGVYVRTKPRSKETRLKISLSMKGKQNRLGTHTSETTKVKLSRLALGRKRPDVANENNPDGREMMLRIVVCMHGLGENYYK